MPRKPKPPQKTTITVIVNNVPISVVLHPPTDSRKSWYAYWSGLVTSKSTGQPRLEDAIVAAENMVKTGGRKPGLSDAILSDAEFEQIQRAHYERKHDPQERARAEKTLQACLEAISAFREITGLKPISAASPEDCYAFQQKALTLPKNWRHLYPNSK